MMSQIVFFLCRINLILLLTTYLVASRASAQQLERTFSHPPTSFSAEDDKFPHAVPIPSCVRRLLAIDRDVVSALEYEQLSPEQLPSDWFTASERDLGQSGGTYLVVMAAGLMRGANINPFWIFRHAPNSCDLLLSVGAHDLEVLKARTNGLPDVKIASATAVDYFESKYKFDGKNYQIVKRLTQPIGEELPHNLTDFAARKLLVQGVRQTPDSILCEARAWLWRQWWLEKPAYLKVTLHAKEGDETTTTYFVRKSGGDLQVMIHTHQIFVDRSPYSGVRHPMVEDQIVVAGDVERRLALKDNPDRRTNIPEGQEAPSDTYELYFNDESGNNLAIL
jgi:hypothetical protein